MSAKVTIIWSVSLGYDAGDYARLCGNGGSGDIDYDNPLTNEKFQLFPDGGGIYGWYHQPWGKFAWYHGHSSRTPGWYHQPWGKFPWYYGTAVIEVEYEVETCGDYKFALQVYDSLGNANTGSPEEVTAIIHIAPPAPDIGLKKNSYDKGTDILVLDVAA